MLDLDHPWQKRKAMRCRSLYRKVIDRVRIAARKVGYAIATHGSLARDIDLVAIPWTDDAVSSKLLARVVIETVKAVHGIARINISASLIDGRWVRRGDPFRGKPHGRACWSIHLGGGPYIDLSVMPRRPA